MIKSSITPRLVTLIALIASSAPAAAYVGPGAGITMLGSLWGLIVAVVFVIVGLLVLPIKLMRNKAKKKAAEKAAAEAAANSSTEEN